MYYDDDEQQTLALMTALENSHLQHSAALFVLDLLEITRDHPRLPYPTASISRPTFVLNQGTSVCLF